jgi:hypothetical protein
MKILLAILGLCWTAGVAFAEVPFEEESSDHFIVYYEKGVAGDFVKMVVEHAERYYNDLTDKLGFRLYDYWTWDKRAKVYIYAQKETYVAGTGQPEWSGGVAAYDRKTIWTYPRGAGFFDSLLPHEIGHIIFREVVGKREIPLWLEEGVACYLEPARRYGAEDILVEAIQADTFMNFDALAKVGGDTLRQQAVDVSLFYASAVSLVNFLIDNYGIERFNRFCEKLRDRKSVDDALAYAYFDVRSQSDLGEQWETFLRKKAGVKPRMVL